jgi:hypothetical protein
MNRRSSLIPGRRWKIDVTRGSGQVCSPVVLVEWVLLVDIHLEELVMDVALIVLVPGEWSA